MLVAESSRNQPKLVSNPLQFGRTVPCVGRTLPGRSRSRPDLIRNPPPCFSPPVAAQRRLMVQQSGTFPRPALTSGRANSAYRRAMPLASSRSSGHGAAAELRPRSRCSHTATTCHQRWRHVARSRTLLRAVFRNTRFMLLENRVGVGGSRVRRGPPGRLRTTKFAPLRQTVPVSPMFMQLRAF